MRCLFLALMMEKVSFERSQPSEVWYIAPADTTRDGGNKGRKVGSVLDGSDHASLRWPALARRNMASMLLLLPLAAAATIYNTSAAHGQDSEFRSPSLRSKLLPRSFVTLRRTLTAPLPFDIKSEKRQFNPLSSRRKYLFGETLSRPGMK